MDSQAEQSIAYDIDIELETWLRKEADAQGIDPSNPYANEVEMIQQWQQNPTPEGFEELHNLHAPTIFDATRGYMQSTTLPKAAVRGYATQRYAHALQTFDPTRGAQFKSHLFNEMRRVGDRYLPKYQNVGRIPPDRSWLIPMVQASMANLTEMLGRPPTDIELSDDVLLSPKDISDLQRKKITPKFVGTVRRELRRDLTTELPGGEAESAADSDLRRQIVFLHGGLNPEQQLVLEHTYEGFSKPVFDNDDDVGRATNMSPQKVRAIKAQIFKKVERFWKQPKDL